MLHTWSWTVTIFTFNFFLNPFPPKLAKTAPFVSLLCLMPGKFSCQVRASRWKRVKCFSCYIFSELQLVIALWNFPVHNKQIML